jgi:hypothetical protein
LFEQSLQWIATNSAAGQRIKCVLHTGDVTQRNFISEWNVFKKALDGFQSDVPFISAIGDHDYTWDGALINSRDSTYFSNYVVYPSVMSRIVASYESGRMENIIVRNEINGARYDIIVLEFGPRVEVVKWANEWISSHPDIKYILLNHEYLEKGGGRRTNGLKCYSRFKNNTATTYTTPNDLWKQLIKCNDNVVCVICGHVGGLYAITFDTNDFGHEVAQIEHNIQGSNFRYDNWLMVWEFPQYSDYASVSVVNTATGLYYNNSLELFRFRY